MRKISYGEGSQILKELLKDSNKINRLKFTKHFFQRLKIRNIDLDYVKNMVLNTEPLGVLSSVENKFKVFYPSEHNNYEDLIVIIAIDDNNDIIILTVFEDSISKRIGKENL